MSITSQLLRELQNEPVFSECFAYCETDPKRNGRFQSQSMLPPRLIEGLSKLGLNNLYEHQMEAIERILHKENVVIATGTASGKSLCYQIPIISKYFETGKSTALLLFPTKALTNDQQSSMRKFCQAALPDINVDSFAAVYDGDTPSANRSIIRKNAQILMTNPDMLNVALLPYHTNWSRFFENLQFIIIDEVHHYRGVFGSHFCNILRRLKRILEFYGSKPQFILTSATIGNPKELAEWIIEQPVSVVDNDMSPRGEKNTLLYNPPVLNQEFNIREGLLPSTSKLASFFLKREIQTLIFCRTRRFVELVVKDLRTRFPKQGDSIRGYRSGYLKSERREIESGLKNGSIKLVAATNALELGVDIGGVDAVLIAGYPGSVASIRQMSGRAGRHQTSSVSLIISSMNPLDQYFARFPNTLFSRPVEKALVDPNNPLILLPHLQASAFEYPFDETTNFGNLNFEMYSKYLDYLVEENYLQKKQDKYFWLSDSFPAGSFSIRSTASANLILQAEDEFSKKTIGEVDYNSSLWMCHPGAVYLHDGNEYLVDKLDLDQQIITLSQFRGTYFTEPIKKEEITIDAIEKEKSGEKFTIRYGAVQVLSQVTGYKKIDSTTKEILSVASLELPSTTLATKGFWITLNPACVDQLRKENKWYGDKNDYGPDWQNIRKIVLQRDSFQCQVCGKRSETNALHVHHKIPFKAFTTVSHANSIDNLITLCGDCHKLAELNVKIRNCVGGLRYVLSNLAPLLVLCDSSDLDSFSDSHAPFADLMPVVLLHDTVPGGIGLSDSLFERIDLLVSKSYDLVKTCTCSSGCPSCVGPDFENGMRGKEETEYLISLLMSELCQP